MIAPIEKRIKNKPFPMKRLTCLLISDQFSAISYLVRDDQLSVGNRIAGLHT